MAVGTVWYVAEFLHDSGRLTNFTMDGFSRANVKHRLSEHPDFLEFKNELEYSGDRIVNCCIKVAVTEPIRAGLHSIITVPYA